MFNCDGGSYIGIVAVSVGVCFVIVGAIFGFIELLEADAEADAKALAEELAKLQAEKDQARRSMNEIVLRSPAIITCDDA